MECYILECYNRETKEQKWMVKKKRGSIIWTSNPEEAKHFWSIDRVCSYWGHHYGLFENKDEVIIVRRLYEGRWLLWKTLKGKENGKLSGFEWPKD